MTWGLHLGWWHTLVLKCNKNNYDQLTGMCLLVSWADTIYTRWHGCGCRSDISSSVSHVCLHYTVSQCLFLAAPYRMGWRGYARYTRLQLLSAELGSLCTVQQCPCFMRCWHELQWMGHFSQPCCTLGALCQICTQCKGAKMVAGVPCLLKHVKHWLEYFSW